MPSTSVTCKMCDLVSTPLYVSERLEKQVGVLSYRYYSKPNEVCLTAETYDGWRFALVKVDASTEKLETPDPHLFYYQSEPFRNSYFTRCFTPQRGAVKCGTTELYLYFNFEATFESGSMQKVGWAYGTAFSGNSKGWHNSYPTCCETLCPSDNDPCTDDVCISNGVCAYTPNTQPCDDGDECTVGDTCHAGSCKPGGLKNCDDGNECTDDLCQADLCVHKPNAATCNDNNMCTSEDTCVDGTCTGTLKKCDDRSICTTDSCDSQTGTCVFVPNNQPCECTRVLRSVVTETGKNIGYLSFQYASDAGQFCFTADASRSWKWKRIWAHVTPQALQPPFDPKKFEFSSATLDSAYFYGCFGDTKIFPCKGNLFYVYFFAEAFRGKITEPVWANGIPIGEKDGYYSKYVTCCDSVSDPAPCPSDNNPCTSDDRSEEGNCQYKQINGSCDDGNACTLDDSCLAGFCVPGRYNRCDDNNTCTDDLCSAVTGECTHTPNTDTCSDGNDCTMNDLCANGKCVPGKAQLCFDNNACTNDTCAPSGGCIFSPNELPCTTNDLCLHEGRCQAGRCVPGLPIKCEDDGNACTIEYCNPKTGECLTIESIGECEDGDPCTVNDMCDDGICIPGDPKRCDDANHCTADMCDPKTGGCVHMNLVNTACNDGDLCTVNDVCQAGICVSGPKVECEDKNACTHDFCDANTGSCLHVFKNGACDDGNPCTVDEFCEAGKCIPGKPKNCDDKLVCTDDQCDMETGDCSHKPNKIPCVCESVSVPLYAGRDLEGAGRVNFQYDSMAKKVCFTLDTHRGWKLKKVKITVSSEVLNPPPTPSSFQFVSENLNSNYYRTCVVPTDPSVSCSGTTLYLYLQTDTVRYTRAGSVNATELSWAFGTPVSGYRWGWYNPYRTCCDSTIAPVTCLPETNPCLDVRRGLDGTCSAVPNKSPCQIPGTCTDDVCVDGKCTVGLPKKCDDKNLCTTDSCVDGKCIFIPNTLICDDGNACTSDDVCIRGVCTGTPKDCSSCTLDTCNPKTGECSHLGGQVNCDDGNECTTGDTCKGLVCVPGPARSCNDNNVCTLDGCNPETGECKHVSLCPRPALNDVPTLAARWSVSGYIDVFTTRNLLVVQWTAAPGWTAKVINLYLNMTRPERLPPPEKFPYWQSSVVALKYAEILVPLSDFASATCDSSFYISIHVETFGDSTVKCGINYSTGKKDACQGAKNSWMLADSTTSRSSWDSLFTFSMFCCCFDPTPQFTSVTYKKVHFTKGPESKDDESARSFVVNLFARLLAIPPSTISLALRGGDENSYEFVVKFRHSRFTSAATVKAILDVMDPVHYEHLGGKDFVVSSVSSELDELEWTSSSASVPRVLGAAWKFLWVLAILYCT